MIAMQSQQHVLVVMHQLMPKLVLHLKQNLAPYVIAEAEPGALD